MNAPHLSPVLPAAFAAWFAKRGWTPRPHQLAMLDAARHGVSALLIAPTGGGKTLAGFLPSLVDLAENGAGRGLHTLYISPLKALAEDIARNLTQPVEEIGLAIRIETRTGDTNQTQRRRQKADPPDILLTTPESLALMLSFPEAQNLFATLSCIVMDEIHAIAGTKRGDQLALCTARLCKLAPALRMVGLSATIAHPDAIAAYVAPFGRVNNVRRIIGMPGAPPQIDILTPPDNAPRAQSLPWSGHMGLFAAPLILRQIATAGMSIVFVNTRAQAELLFEALWRINTDTLPIAMHHGSLDPAQRRRVEQAMASGQLRCVIATASLDLGIDWAGVDQVIQLGAPKGVARLLQRIGRANHRMDTASRAVLLPANRFEALECEAAREGALAGEIDGDAPPPGALDVLAQHLLGLACAAPFRAEDVFAEVRCAAPYATLDRRDFDDVLRFVSDGGYALAAYDQHRKLFTDSEGLIWVRDEKTARQHRMNIGTIVEAPMLRVRQRRGAVLGEVEESFASALVPGDTFLFGGRLLRFEGLRDLAVEVTQGQGGEPRVPVYAGGRLPLSTDLAARVRCLIHDPARWHVLPHAVQEWLALQEQRSRLPGPDGLLVEIFPRAGRWYLVAYCFEGRNAHQTLGLLITRRLEQAGAAPLGFVATDYVLACWCVHEPRKIDALFAQDMLRDDLEEWMADSALLRRMFRTVAVIAGLLVRNTPGAGKNRRQLTVNADLLYDVLRRHEPDHVLLRATRADAARGLTDLDRIGQLLRRIAGRIETIRLDRVSPLAVPSLLEIGRERIAGGAGEEALLAEAEAIILEGMSA